MLLQDGKWPWRCLPNAPHTYEDKVQPQVKASSPGPCLPLSSPLLQPSVHLLCLGSCIRCFPLGHTLPFELSKLPLTRLVSDQAALPPRSCPAPEPTRLTMESCAAELSQDL